VYCLYEVSAKKSFPDLRIHIFHTITSKNPLKKIRTLITNFKPDIIGLRSLSIARKQFKETAHLIRECCSGCHLIAGGPYPSSSYQDLLLTGLVDMVVIGEGEITFVELIKHLRNSRKLPLNLDGTAVIKKGQLHINKTRSPIQNLDAIPFPDYSPIDLKDYKGISNHALQDSSQSAFICSSRGCPYECFYCHQLFGKRIRRRTPDNLITEMQEHVEKRHINNFVFLDDIFNVPKKNAKEILAHIAKKLPDIHISFPNGLRADQLDEELIHLFEEAGTVEMALAVETASPRLQKLIGKQLNLEKAKKNDKFCFKTVYRSGFFYDRLPNRDI